MKPSSFCTISTYNCHHELYTMLLSLSLYHPGALVICLVDIKTKYAINNYIIQPKLNVKWEVCLDKYSMFDRKQMVERNLWDEFQMMKAKSISIALNNAPDTLFLDSDIIILSEINNIDKTKQLGVSPHYICKKDTDKYGYYNGGVLWTNSKELPAKWIEYTKTSRFYDQASIEDLVKVFSHFEFGENYNMSWWRMFQSDVSVQDICNNFTIVDNKIYYKNCQLKFIHTHFNDNKGITGIFNKIIIDLLSKINDYKTIQLIFREINNSWILSIPKQPIKGKFSHSNDSYRALAQLISYKYSDIKFKECDNRLQCWLEPNIVLYDRPTLDWCSDEMKSSNLIMLANGNMQEEGNILKNTYTSYIKPWLFWPRHVDILEKYILRMPSLKYDERNIESIFIGNYENSIQSKYRNSNIPWNTVIDEFHNTKGSKHKFSQEEYLNYIRRSKYGLCLRGFGSKCHREVELMSLGTVPIITPEVSINDYIDPPKENIHFIRVDNPDDIKSKIASIDKEKWQSMSDSCIQWYYKNIHSNNFMKVTLEYIFYS